MRKDGGDAIVPSLAGTSQEKEIMANNFQLRFIVAAAAFALLGTACDIGPGAATADGCTVTTNYEIACPTGDAPELKPN